MCPLQASGKPVFLGYSLKIHLIERFTRGPRKNAEEVEGSQVATPADKDVRSVGT
jgi:hypothetical protein